MLRMLIFFTLWLNVSILPCMVAVGQSDRSDSAPGYVKCFTVPEDPNGNTNTISDLAFSPDGKMLVVTYGRFSGLLQEPDPGQTIVWDVESGKRLTILQSYQDGVSSVDFSADGKVLATGCYNGTVQLWRVPDWSRQARIKVTQGFVKSLHFSPDNLVLAVGTWRDGEDNMKNTINLYDVATGRKIASLNGHTGWVMSVQFSPDGKLLVSSSMDGTVRIWNIQAGTNQIIAKSDELMILSAAFSHDGQLVAVGGGPFKFDKWEFRLWNTQSWKLKAQRIGSGRPLSAVKFSPDNHWLGTSSRGCKVKLWNLSTKQSVDISQPGHKMAFSPDGKLLALASRRDITLLLFEKLIDKKITKK